MLEKLSDHRVDELWAGVRKAPSRKEIEALAGELRERRHAENAPAVCEKCSEELICPECAPPPHCECGVQLECPKCDKAMK